MGMPAIKRRGTTDEVRALMDESRPWPRYELVDGRLLVTPSPGVVHQVAVMELLTILIPYVDRNSLGITLVSPADLERQPGEITQPDLFVVPLKSPARLDRRPTWADVATLILAVEVISPSSARSDRVLKRRHYMAAGVPEYWIVDLDERSVERWCPLRSTPTTEAAVTLAIFTSVAQLVQIFLSQVYNGQLITRDARVDTRRSFRAAGRRPVRGVCADLESVPSTLGPSGLSPSRSVMALIASGKPPRVEGVERL
ncbi:MAG: Uma2 family endonuclease [Gemmatimonadaceae bacterium]